MTTANHKQPVIIFLLVDAGRTAVSKLVEDG